MGHVLRSSGYETSDVEIVRAEDCTLYTADGRAFVDFEAGVWAAALGHNHPRIRSTVEAQLDRISHIGYRVTNPLQEEAAAELLRAAGLPDGRCLFLSSGSEAVEFAVRIARLATGRPLLLTLEESYLAAYGSAGEKRSEDWVLFDRTLCANCPPNLECTLDCPHLEAIPFDRLGAFVFEPGSSGGLIRFPQEKLIRTLLEGVRAHGGLVVANEITTGVGRTGSWFGHQHYGLKPDIVAIGKGLGNGYPVSAIALREAIIDAIEGPDFHYAQSHQNDPLACAIALEVLRVVREERLVERSADVGARFRAGLEELRAKYETVRDVRGRGLMLAIEFESDRDAFVLRDLFYKLLDRGFLVGFKPAARLLRFLPPLTISEEQITGLLGTLAELLHEAAR